MKHNSKRILALVLALALALSLTACGGSTADSADSSVDEGTETTEVVEADTSIPEDVWYTTVPVGTELYSDDTCSVIVTAQESGDSGSSTTLTLTYSGEGALVVELAAYDTEEYTAFAQGGEDYVTSQQYGRFVANAGETDKAVTVEWDGDYEIFDVSVSTTAETVADDADSSIEISDEMDTLYDTTLRVTAAE